MRVIRPHLQLLLAAGSLLSVIPLAALSAVLAQHGPLWKTSWREIAYSSTLAAAVAVLLGWRIARGSRFGWVTAVISGALWVSAMGFSAVLAHNVPLIVLSITLAAFSALWAQWARHEFGRSFFDPRLHWFEGLPKPIPGLFCRISVESRKGSPGFEEGHPGEWGIARVCRLDREGAFIYSERTALPEKIEQVTFLFRDRHVSCVGVVVCTLDRARERSGVGFQFRGMSLDSRKVLGDFVESLRGEGYV